MRRASGINLFIFIPKLVDSNREYISYDFGTIYSLPCKLNLDLKFLISFHENIILFLFLFYFYFYFYFYFIENIILFLFYFYFILFLLFYFILFFLIFIFYLFILFYFIFFIKRNVYQHF